MRRFVLSIALACFAVTLDSAGAKGQLSQVVKGTCRLQGDGSSATCFLVGVPDPSGREGPRRLLATAAHVLEKMKGDTATLVLRRWDDKAEEYVRVPRPLMIRREVKPLWSKNSGHDVVVMELPEFDDPPIEAIPLDMLASEEDFRNLEPGQLVRCVGYPHAAQFDTSKPGFPLVRLGCVANFPLAPVSKHPTFLVDFNTFEGDSGGPVVVDLGAGAGEPGFKLIGVIHGQHFLDELYTLVYQKGHIRKRRGLSIVVNSQAILETVQSCFQR